MLLPSPRSSSGGHGKPPTPPADWSVGPNGTKPQPITAFAKEQSLNEYDLNFSINILD
jgi:hypothetical protein